MIDVMRTAGKAQLVSWTEVRLAEGSQDAWARGTLVGVEARADGTLALADPGSPVFNRSSVAYLSDGTQVASGQPRFETVGGRTGVLVEEGTQNIIGSVGDFEADSDGDGVADGWSFILYGAVASLSNDALFGRKSQRITSTAGDTNHARRVEKTVSIVGGKTYTFSAYAKTDGVTPAEIRIDTNGASPVTLISPQTTATTWTKLQVTFTAPSDATQVIVRCYNRTRLGAEGWVQFDGAQLEEKAYSTSWTDGTRAAETLTVPTAGVVDPQEGTFESWIYIPSASFGRAAVVLDVRDSTGLDRLYFEVAADKKSTAAIRKNATSYVAQGPNPLSPGWHFVAMSWSSTRLACYADGALVAQYTSPPLLDNIATAALGSLTASAYHFNSLIGPVRISRRARTDQEIADAYAAGTLELDEDTTLLLPLDGSLAYGRGGYRIAPAVDLSRVGLVYASRLEWEADDAGVEVQTSLDGGQTWQQAQNGGPVPSIVPGQDVTGKTLLVKQCLLAQDMAAAPALRRFDTRVISEPRLAKHQGRVELLGGG